MTTRLEGSLGISLIREKYHTCQRATLKSGRVGRHAVALYADVISCYHSREVILGEEEPNCVSGKRKGGRKTRRCQKSGCAALIEKEILNYRTNYTPPPLLFKTPQGAGNKMPPEQVSGSLFHHFTTALITSSRVTKQIIFCEQVALKP